MYNNRYMYGIYFSKCPMFDNTDIEETLKKHFVLYKWDKWEKVPHLYYKHMLETQDGAWIPVAKRMCNKWKKLNIEQQRQVVFRSNVTLNNDRPYMRLHMLFKDTEELQEWMGEERYKELMLELL